MRKTMKNNIYILIVCCLISFIFTLFSNQVFALESYKQLYLKGVEYKEKGQYEEALQAFTQAIKESDQDHLVDEFINSIQSVEKLH